MIIELNPVDLLENTFDYAYRKSDFENAEVFKIRLVEHINKIKNVLDADIDNLSDEEFFKLLVSIYYIRLDNNDYLKLFSKKYNKNYTCIAIIPTTMTFTDICKEGRGNSFDWWEQKYQLQYMVAVSNEIKLDENKVYSKKEIKQLVSDNTIILLNQETKTIEEDELTFIEESVEYLPINFDFDENGNIMSGFILDNYDLYMEILREKFTKAKIYNDMQKYISYLRDDIKHIINCDDNISQLCKEYYEKEGIKSSLDVLQRRIK